MADDMSSVSVKVYLSRDVVKRFRASSFEDLCSKLQLVCGEDFPSSDSETAAAVGGEFQKIEYLDDENDWVTLGASLDEWEEASSFHADGYSSLKIRLSSISPRKFGFSHWRGHRRGRGCGRGRGRRGRFFGGFGGKRGRRGRFGRGRGRGFRRRFEWFSPEEAENVCCGQMDQVPRWWRRCHRGGRGRGRGMGRGHGKFHGKKMMLRVRIRRVRSKLSKFRKLLRKLERTDHTEDPIEGASELATEGMDSNRLGWLSTKIEHLSNRLQSLKDQMGDLKKKNKKRMKNKKNRRGGRCGRGRGRRGCWHQRDESESSESTSSSESSSSSEEEEEGGALSRRELRLQKKQARMVARNERREARDARRAEMQQNLTVLESMGFGNRRQNRKVLRKNEMNLQATVAELLVDVVAGVANVESTPVVAEE